MFIDSAISSNNLPSEYTELEYIESTGTQYINTGIVPTVTNATKVDVRFKMTDITNGEYQSMGANRNLNMYAQGYLLLFRSCGKQMTNYDTNWHNIVLQQSVSSRLVNFDAISYVSGGSYADATPFYLFAMSGGGQWYGKYQVSSCKIWDNDTLVRNMIPARRNSDYVVGMYDTISNTFFTNSGTGRFIAGPVLEIEIATTKYVETAFSPTVNELNTTIGTIKNVVDNTIIQADRIGKLATGKQNRPDEQCPSNAQCLLITEPDGTLHWYPICNGDGSIFDANIFLTSLTSNADSYYYHGNTTTHNELGGTGSAKTLQPESNSIIRQLNETEWAALWNNTGVVYGTSVCSDHNENTIGAISNVVETETKGSRCWCKMTSVADASGVEHSVSNTLWIFTNASYSASLCAYRCAFACGFNMNDSATFRSAMLNGAN